MSDPDIEREEAANAARNAEHREAERDTGVLGTIERGLGFIRRREDEPESAEEVERQRIANDRDQRQSG